MIAVTLAPQYEKLNPVNPFATAMSSLLYHQYRTYEALKTHDLVINAYSTGTGKTRAALLHLHDIPNTNVLFIAPTNELIRQHVNDIKKFVERHCLDFHVVQVNAEILRTIGVGQDVKRHGEILYRLIKNPLEFAEQLGLDASGGTRKALILVVNPDIFYYGLYYAYRACDKRNVAEAFLMNFNYVVIDEFHYYNVKQLANFLFFFTICQEFGYFDGSRKICLLSATPNEDILRFLDRVGLRYTLLTPDNEPSESAEYAKVQSLSTVELQVNSLDGLEKLVESSQAIIRKYIVDDKFDGAIISSALWKINQIHQQLQGLPMGRITGAETRESRQIAQYKPLILATPTVDIGYNFEKHQKDRQNIDFIYFDGYFQDDFIQRLGRAGRTLGKPITDRLSYAYAVTDQAVIQALQQRGHERYERKEFAALLREHLPPKHEFQAYIKSYALLEAFYPIYQLTKIMPPHLAEILERLFEHVKAVFAPNSTKTFQVLRAKMRTYDEQTSLLKEPQIPKLRPYLGSYVREQTDQPTTPEQIEHLYGIMASRKDLQEQVLDFVRREHELTRALFNFRDAFSGPPAVAYDPQHSLSEGDLVEYDLFHLLANFDCRLHPKERFAELTPQTPPQSEFYLEIKSFRSPRLQIGLKYEANCLQERFEQQFGNQLKVLRNLNLMLTIPGNGEYPLESSIKNAIRDQYIPCLIVKLADRGRLYGLLRKKSLFHRTLLVQVEDSGKPLEYPIVLGTAAFLVYAELAGYFLMKERKEGDCFIV